MAEKKPVRFDAVEMTRLMLIGLGLLALFVLAYFLLRSAVEMLLLLFAGILFAIFTRGVSRFLFGRWDFISEKVGITLTVLLFAVSMVLFIILLVPQLAEQGDKLASQLPEAIDKLTSRIKFSGNVLELFLGKEGGSQAAKEMAGRALGFFATTFGAITSLFILFFVGLYLSYSPHYYIRGLLRLVPGRERPRADQVIQGLGFILERWMIGRFIGMLVVSIATYLGLLALQVPLALSLAVLAGLLTFIPNIGPIISAVPAVLLGFMQSPATALYVTGLYLGIQTVESYLITPLIQEKEAALPPVLTLSAQVVLGSALGLLGLALATPLTAAAMVLVKMLYIEQVLDDQGGVDGVVS